MSLLGSVQQQRRHDTLSAAITVDSNGPVVRGTTTNVELDQIVSMSVNGQLYTARTELNGSWAIPVNEPSAHGTSISVSVTNGAGATAFATFNFQQLVGYRSNAAAEIDLEVISLSLEGYTDTTGEAQWQDPITKDPAWRYDAYLNSLRIAQNLDAQSLHPVVVSSAGAEARFAVALVDPATGDYGKPWLVVKNMGTGPATQGSSSTWAEVLGVPGIEVTSFGPTIAGISQNVSQGAVVHMTVNATPYIAVVGNDGTWSVEVTEPDAFGDTVVVTVSDGADRTASDSFAYQINVARRTDINSTLTPNIVSMILDGYSTTQGEAQWVDAITAPPQWRKDFYIDGVKTLSSTEVNSYYPVNTAPSALVQVAVCYVDPATDEYSLPVVAEGTMLVGRVADGVLSSWDDVLGPE